MSNYELATNPNTPSEILERLANDNNWCVRSGVVRNPNTPPETLERMANDEDSCVRYWVTFNPNTPQYIRTYFKIKRILRCYE
jgi:hypothetical protein